MLKFLFVVLIIYPSYCKGAIKSIDGSESSTAVTIAITDINVLAFNNIETNMTSTPSIFNSSENTETTMVATENYTQTTNSSTNTNTTLMPSAEIVETTTFSTFYTIASTTANDTNIGVPNKKTTRVVSIVVPIIVVLFLCSVFYFIYQKR